MINNILNYECKRNLEEINTNLVFIDVNAVIEYRNINVYRSFSLERDATPPENVINQ